MAVEPKWALTGLLVSCQALSGSPLEGPVFMAAMARAAEAGGCTGFRVNGPADVSAVRAVSELPLIGINKAAERGLERVYITPTFASAEAVVAAGANVVALDGTPRPRPGGEQLHDIISRLHDKMGVKVMADVDSLRSGIFAAQAGADYVATTLSGTTLETACSRTTPPDLRLIGQLVRELDVPVVAEGRLQSPAHVGEAFALGASAVVVGTAITNPTAITALFIAACTPYLR